MTDRLAELSAAGVAVWLDDLSRVRLTSGSLDKLRREQHVVGVTTNPSIFQKALSDADAYDEQLRDLEAAFIRLRAKHASAEYQATEAADIMSRKNFAATGSFVAEDRPRALDLLVGDPHAISGGKA